MGAIADVVMDAGTRIFAVMDEASCGGTADCVGVLAVDLDRTTPLQATVLPDGGVVADGGTVPRVRYPVAIDGFDNLRDFIDPSTGLPLRVPDGGTFQIADTFYRSPATFPDGGPRDANRMLVIRFGNNTAVGHHPGRGGPGGGSGALPRRDTASVRAARPRHHHRVRQQHPDGADLRLRRDDAPADQLTPPTPRDDPADDDALRERKPGQLSGRASEHPGRGRDLSVQRAVRRDRAGGRRHPVRRNRRPASSTSRSTPGSAPPGRESGRCRSTAAPQSRRATSRQETSWCRWTAPTPSASTRSRFSPATMGACST